MTPCAYWPRLPDGLFEQAYRAHHAAEDGAPEQRLPVLKARATSGNGDISARRL
ncbi:hypothetical protein OG749_44460 [Streptomyces nojiriensis]|uniref:hypothetical protein n=1 Tax=Streptomyces nojiriensis TaxID=66374 RepID=UPI002E178374